MIFQKVQKRIILITMVYQIKNKENKDLVQSVGEEAFCANCGQ